MLLLRAALLDSADAIAAWNEWRAGVDLEQLDAASERLLPLLAHNLKRHGLADPPLGRYAGLLHYTWVANQRRLAQLTPAATALAAADIPVMLLKGMALALHYYQHPGLRPMDDVDLLVPASRAGDAIDLLRRHGWESSSLPSDFGTKHSSLFTSAAGGQLDLHWHALYELAGQKSDADLWARAERIARPGPPMTVMGPEDLLLHVVVHGARWSAVPPIRWAADAAAILAKTGERFDWARLVTDARAHAFMLPLRNALEFLAGEIGVVVPDRVLEELRAHEPSRFERIEQRMREWTSPVLGGFPVVLCQHWRMTRHDSAWSRLWRLPRYLQHAYDLPSLGGLPSALWRRAVRRVRQESRVRRVRQVRRATGTD